MIESEHPLGNGARIAFRREAMSSEGSCAVFMKCRTLPAIGCPCNCESGFASRNFRFDRDRKKAAKKIHLVQQLGRQWRGRFCTKMTLILFPLSMRDMEVQDQGFDPALT